MKLLINCSNLSFGGGVQASLSIINEIISSQFSNIDVNFILSEAIYNQLDPSYKCLQSIHFIKYKKNIFSRLFYLNLSLNRIEKKIKPDIVFSIFGPNFWKPVAPHLVGFANPWIIYPKSEAFNLIHPLFRPIIKLKYALMKYVFKYSATHMVVETEEVKKRVNKILKVPNKNIHIVPNTYSKIYSNATIKYKNTQKSFIEDFYLLCLTHDYIHKNISVLADVLENVNRRGVKCKLYLTLTEKDFETKPISLKRYAVNMGPVPVEKCPALYEKADAIILPTLLECFTANFPEAMKMGVPILTSDRPFSHDICHNAALFFDPLDVDDISNKIINIATDEILYRKLINEGHKRSNDFILPNQRALHYIELCMRILNLPIPQDKELLLEKSN